MRVLVAPDKFAGTLSAHDAASAISQGWLETAPDDEVQALAMSDGGPGFLEILHESVGGSFQEVDVRDTYGDPVKSRILRVGDAAYLESASICGLALTERQDPMVGSSFGLGQAIGAVLTSEVRRIVVGLGGTGVNDGGAGLLVALGATADSRLDAGPNGFARVNEVDIRQVQQRLQAVELIGAADTTAPLLGMFGATKVFGPQKGLSEEQVFAVDRTLDRFVDAVCGSTPRQRGIADQPHAGAAGGIGFALLALGGTLQAGVDLVAEAVDLPTHVVQNDLIISGEGSFDYSSRTGKVVYGVAQAAADAAKPCVVIAGQVDVGAREMRALGVESAYGLVDAVGVERAMNEPAVALQEIAARVARTWSRNQD